jgi:hypothetical protein
MQLYGAFGGYIVLMGKCRLSCEILAVHMYLQQKSRGHFHEGNRPLLLTILTLYSGHLGYPSIFIREFTVDGLVSSEITIMTSL